MACTHEVMALAIRPCGYTAFDRGRSIWKIGQKFLIVTIWKTGPPARMFANITLLISNDLTRSFSFVGDLYSLREPLHSRGITASR